MQIVSGFDYHAQASNRVALPVPSMPASTLASRRHDTATSPAPAGRLGAASAAVDGVARLVSDATHGLAPFLDFPGITAGAKFDIVKGSKVGFLGVKGDAEVVSFTDDEISFRIRAGALGIKVNVQVNVARTGPDTVRISSRGTGIPDVDAEGRVVESRRNHAHFERIDNPAERTIIDHDGRGRLEIDTVVPTFGGAHLVLVRRP